MADIKTPEERSRNMAAIRGVDTKPEIILRKWLFAAGYRYRTHVKGIPGCPDIYLPKYKTAIFVHGCFWHRHAGCRFAYVPKSRVDFWKAKYEYNTRRDSEVRKLLEEKAIKCMIVWECTIKKMTRNNEYKEDIIENIRSFLCREDNIYEL